MYDLSLASVISADCLSGLGIFLCVVLSVDFMEHWVLECGQFFESTVEHKEDGSS